MIQKRRLPRISLSKVLGDPEAETAWQELMREGASASELEKLLQMAVFGQFLGHTYDMLYVDGLTKHQVSNFPALLRQIAGNIDGIWETPYFYFEKKADLEILNLPSTLRRYADQLQDSIESARTFLRKNPRYLDQAAIHKLKLLNYVRETTGSPHYATVARLLNGAFTTVDMETIIEPSSLRKLFERQPKRKLTLRVK